MKKFEYLKTVNSTIQELNELGSIGWELTSVFVTPNAYSIYENYIFKREINEQINK